MRARSAASHRGFLATFRPQMDETDLPDAGSSNGWTWGSKSASAGSRARTADNRRLRALERGVHVWQPSFSRLFLAQIATAVLRSRCRGILERRCHPAELRRVAKPGRQSRGRAAWGDRVAARHICHECHQFEKRFLIHLRAPSTGLRWAGCVKRMCLNQGLFPCDLDQRGFS